MDIRLLTVADLDIAASHLERHLDENGMPGDPLFAPFSQSAPFDLDNFRKTRAERWSNPVDGTNFERMWGGFVATDDGDRLVAHADVRRTGLASEGHRVWLGMGIERAARGRGHGRQLLDTAIAWAIRTPSVDWIDLGVFEENTPAIRLYETAGFQRTGLVEDRFRIDGRKINDIQMSLRIQRTPTASVDNG